MRDLARDPARDRLERRHRHRLAGCLFVIPILIIILIILILIVLLLLLLLLRQHRSHFVLGSHSTWLRKRGDRGHKRPLLGARRNEEKPRAVRHALHTRHPIHKV